MNSPTFVVGTAGHVDHGKSSLVRALTGANPDRLAEEQLREMTIDLGFAELTTPGGNRIHLVDVPGHERFVRNMLAGAGGIDAAIMVIAADDGPMPQTREHLAILDLLGISHGVVALSKADLVDSEWLDLVVDSTRGLLDGTALANSEIVPVSSITGMGLDDLQSALDRMLSRFERSFAVQPARLPIDRVFTMSGFGTVVTGTLTGAPISVGDRVDLLPGGQAARIRGLQSFGRAVQRALPGSRVAVNLAGVDVTDLTRGDVLTLPGTMEPAMRMDVSVRLLETCERSLEHNDEVIVFSGAAEVPARAAMLDGDRLEAGRDGWVQLRLARPMVAHPGDRFILRRPSPPETIGGGSVVELDPPRHKRNQPGVVARLEQLAEGDPADRLLTWIGNRLLDERQVLNSPLGEESSRRAIERLVSDRRLTRQGIMLVNTTRLHQISAAVLERVDRFHRQHPLEAGMPRELLREGVGLDRVALDTLLSSMEEIDVTGPLVRRKAFHISFETEQQRRVDAYLQLLERHGYQPPTPEESEISADLRRALAQLGSIVEIGDGIVFLPEQLTGAHERLIEMLTDQESISLAEYRDALGTTRRFAQALLEYFDRQRVTRRIGDRRVAARPIERREESTAR